MPFNVCELNALEKISLQTVDQLKLVYNNDEWDGSGYSFKRDNQLQKTLNTSANENTDYWVRASNGSAVRVYCDMRPGHVGESKYIRLHWLMHLLTLDLHGSDPSINTYYVNLPHRSPI